MSVVGVYGCINGVWIRVIIGGWVWWALGDIT